MANNGPFWNNTAGNTFTYTYTPTTTTGALGGIVPSTQQLPLNLFPPTPLTDDQVDENIQEAKDKIAMRIMKLKKASMELTYLKKVKEQIKTNPTKLAEIQKEINEIQSRIGLW